MNEKTNKIVRLCYGIALSVMTAIAGSLFLWQVLDNFLTGPVDGNKFTFTQAGLAARFLRVSPAFWIWVAMIIIGFVIWEVFKVEQKKSAYKDPRYALARLNKRIPVPSAEMVKRQENLKILWLFFSAFAFIAIIYSVAYLSISSHFTVAANATPEVLNMLKNILPWAFAAFNIACGICIYEGVSAKKLLPAAGKLAAGNRPVQQVHGKLYEILHNKYFKLGVRVCVGCVAVSFIIAGICNGNILNILDKAINICTECIGLG